MKRVLVTGSSRGIGRAVALRLAKDGFAVTLHCRQTRAQAEELAAQIKGAAVLVFDVRDRAAAERELLADVEARGAYYGVVLNAGVTRDNAFPALSEDDWESLTTRLRNGAMPYQQLLADTNPDAPTHWLKRRCDAGRTLLLESRHEDNPSVTADYLARLDRLTGARLWRLRHGRWVSAEGVVYEGWDPAAQGPGRSRGMLRPGSGSG